MSRPPSVAGALLHTEVVYAVAQRAGLQARHGGGPAAAFDPPVALINDFRDMQLLHGADYRRVERGHGDLPRPR